MGSSFIKMIMLLPIDPDWWMSGLPSLALLACSGLQRALTSTLLGCLEPRDKRRAVGGIEKTMECNNS